MKLSLVIPAYNESRHLEEVLRHLRTSVLAFEPDAELVVVDNGSTDDTQEILRRLSLEMPELHPVRVYPNEGYSPGIAAGLRAAQGDVLGWLHADAQANPDDLRRIYETLVKENLDLCKASRVVRHESAWRRFQSNVYNRLFLWLFGLGLRDINGTPKLFTKSLYQSVSLKEKRWLIDPEIILEAHAKGFQMKDVPIVWGKRSSGGSNVRLTTMFEFISYMIRTRMSPKHPYATK